MRIIQEAGKTIATYWGEQPCKEVDYRLIHYHIKAQCGDDTLLLNTVTGELVLLSQAEADFLTGLPGRVPEYAEDLIKHHFLVPIDFNEMRSVSQLRAIFRKMGTGDDITGYSILPTTGCNARCFYCFESSYPKISMRPEMVESVVRYIEANHGGKKIWINWFGGEPMVGHSRISEICKLLTEKEIEFNSSMISNGSLFTRELAQVASEKWHLRRVQITLDGSEEVYNRTKAYVGLLGNPYYRVLDNIGYLLDEGIRVIVRLNMDFHNSADIPKVVDELAERYGGRKNFYVYVHELFEDEGYDPVHHSRDERRIIEARRAELETYIVERDCQCGSANGQAMGSLPALRNIYCMADNPESVLINPLGQLGKCEHHIFKHLVGDINSSGNGINKADYDYWMNPNMLSECQHCGLFPYCAIPVICDGGNGCRSEVSQSRISSVRKQMEGTFLSYKKEQMKEQEVNEHESTGI
jgi:radical SAM protein with 4Fe4S-binding SPASM domain